MNNRRRRINDLVPTHKCFDDALEFFGHAVPLDESFLPTVDSYRIVHALMQWPGDDTETYAHAWVEQTGHAAAPGDTLVWQAGLSCPVGELAVVRVYYAVRLRDFERTRTVLKRTRYTVREASIANINAGDYGPWVPEYIAACSNVRGDTGPRVARATPVPIISALVDPRPYEIGPST